MTTQTVRPGVHDITTVERPDGRRYRVYLFEDDVPTLVDTGHEETARELIEALESLGVHPERVLITHGHGDHVGGLDSLVDRFGAEIYAPAGEPIDSTHDVAVRFEDGDMIGSLEAVAVPGHSEHHCAFVDEARSVAVLGDAVFGSDHRGLPSGYYVLPPGQYSTDLNQADASLRRLLEYDFDVALLYHGSNVLTNASGKLDAFVNFPGSA